ncbi:MAG: hypothetical protein IKQ67_07195 [Candidatus Methanomethylophilaceae archaeon]|nr:hypothetical protein [Candidatus Methanomethylophilaceae archaeon]
MCTDRWDSGTLTRCRTKPLRTASRRRSGSPGAMWR